MDEYATACRVAVVTVVVEAPQEGRTESEGDRLVLMVGDLIRANLELHPARQRWLAAARGAVELDFRDGPPASQEAVIGLRFVPGALTVARGSVPGADARLRGRPEDLLQLTTVPLREGLPDIFTVPGRVLLTRLAVSGSRVRIGEAVRGLSLVRIVLRLLQVGSVPAAV